MSKPNNPPAFPSEYSLPENQGMTSRDYFAAKAIEGATVSAASNVRFNHALIAAEAYVLADAMLKAREA
jgi:hypothetical protein